MIVLIIACFLLNINFGYSDDSDKDGPNFVTPQEWRQKALDEHNRYRSMFDIPPLVLNNSLCEASQKWVNELKINHDTRDEPLANMPEGMNYAKNGQEVPPNSTLAIHDWFHEGYYIYNWTANLKCENRGQCGMTRIVWKGSTQFCMSYRIGYGRPWTRILAMYYPIGNVPGKFKENIVFKPRPYFETPKEWRQIALDTNNELRKGFDAPPLVMDEGLCKSSQEHANNLTARGAGKLSHGWAHENLWATGPSYIIPDAKAIVEGWYSEIEWVDLDNIENTPCEKNGRVTCHFTVMVWKRQSKMCMSYSLGYWPPPGPRKVVVIRYDAGNMAGEFGANIIPLKEDGKYIAKGFNPAMLGVYAKKPTGK